MLERKKSTKLKSLFRLQESSNGKTTAGQLKISSPVIQHSTNIYSLVSPIRNSFSAKDPMRAKVPRSVNKHLDERKLSNRRHSCSSLLRDGEQPPRKSTLYNKLRDRRCSHTKTGSSCAAASVITIEPSMSKSTPLMQKVKRYNVEKKKINKDELERQRKTKELEDLITGRRGSTVKLTLTPKGL